MSTSTEPEVGRRSPLEMEELETIQGGESKPEEPDFPLQTPAQSDGTPHPR